MGAFVSGLIQGGANQMNKNKDKKKKKKDPRPAKDLGLPGGEKLADPVRFKRGGRVRRGGMATLHKGEKILSRKRSKRR